LTESGDEKPKPAADGCPLWRIDGVLLSSIFRSFMMPFLPLWSLELAATHTNTRTWTICTRFEVQCFIDYFSRLEDLL